MPVALAGIEPPEPQLDRLVGVQEGVLTTSPGEASLLQAEHEGRLEPAGAHAPQVEHGQVPAAKSLPVRTDSRWEVIGQRGAVERRQPAAGQLAQLEHRPLDGAYGGHVPALGVG